MLRGLPERLLEARKKLGFTQKELAERLGVSWRGLQDNEAGKSIPGGQALAGYASLGVDVGWLLLGEDRPSPTYSAEAARLEPYEDLRSEIRSSTESRIALAHFEPHEIEGPFIRNADERRARAVMVLGLEWLQRLVPKGKLGLPDAVRLATMEMTDDSMPITVPEDSLVLFDALGREIGRGGLFLLVHAGLLTIRRLQVLAEGGVAISDEIRGSQPEKLPAHKLEKLLVGRVMGVLTAGR